MAKLIGVLFQLLVANQSRKRLKYESECTIRKETIGYTAEKLAVTNLERSVEDGKKTEVTDG
jgi:hypothetical protein